MSTPVASTNCFASAGDLPPGAEAFKRDNPRAVVRFFDTGHFAMETHVREIAESIGDFLK
jgi:hypothetical protein